MIDVETGRAYRFNDGFYADGTAAPRDGSIADGVDMLQHADEIGGHNVIPFDIPAITKIYPEFRPQGRVFDTLVAAKLLWPDLYDIDCAAMRKGKRPEGFAKYLGLQKLEAWGFRLGILKAEYSGGWEHFTPEMDSYGAQDPVVTLALYERILAKEPSREALDLEFLVAFILFLQERHGFAFDSGGAEELLRVLMRRAAELRDDLSEAFPPWTAPVMSKGQQVVLIPKRDNARLGYKAGVPVPKFKEVVFNPGSRHHIADRMQTLFGWRPVEFTDNGQPKVDETTLSGLDYPEAKLLVEYLTVEKRLGQIAEGKQAWLKKVRPDGRIHGRVNTLGAITRRMTHLDPNMAQVPSCGAPYGPQCRALFTVSRGALLVGCDAEGLELRELAHYMAPFDGGAYAETVVNGRKEDGTDVHTVNQRIIGLNSRDSAKTWILTGIPSGAIPRTTTL